MPAVYTREKTHNPHAIKALQDSMPVFRTGHQLKAHQVYEMQLFKTQLQYFSPTKRSGTTTLSFQYIVS